MNDLDQFGVNYAFQNLFMFSLFSAALLTLICVSIYGIVHGNKEEMRMKPAKQHEDRDSDKRECPFHMMVPGIDLPLIVFDKAYDPSKFEPITNKSFINKPKGGLWTSPFAPDKGSEWIEWCKNENFGVKDEGSPISILKVKDDGKFLLISTLKDLVEILQIFQEKTFQGNYFDPVLDYESLAQSIDGIYLTTAGQWATRLTHPGLYGWDCETVFIMNKDVIDNVLPGKIEAKWVDRIEDNVENFE